MVCNALVAGWCACTSVPGVMPCSYLNDRYLRACNFDALLHAWNCSLQWEGANLWEVNPSKSAHVEHPHTCGIVGGFGKVVPKKSSIIALGMDLVVVHNGKPAMETAKKIEILHLPPTTAQTLVETVMMPQFAFQLQIRPIA